MDKQTLQVNGAVSLALRVYETEGAPRASIVPMPWCELRRSSLNPSTSAMKAASMRASTMRPISAPNAARPARLRSRPVCIQRQHAT